MWWALLCSSSQRTFDESVCLQIHTAQGQLAGVGHVWDSLHVAAYIDEVFPVGSIEGKLAPNQESNAGDVDLLPRGTDAKAVLQRAHLRIWAGVSPCTVLRSSCAVHSAACIVFDVGCCSLITWQFSLLHNPCSEARGA